MSTENLAEPIGINIVDLDWFAEGDVVRVTPRDQKRFEVQKDHAIEILRVASKENAFRNQLDLLLEFLARWVHERREHIRSAVLTMQDSRLFFVVVRTDSTFDEAFEDGLAELDLNISQDAALDIVRVSTFSLPNVSEDALGSFIDPRFMVRFHGGGD